LPKSPILKCFKTFDSGLTNANVLLSFLEFRTKYKLHQADCNSGKAKAALSAEVLSQSLIAVQICAPAPACDVMRHMLSAKDAYASDLIELLLQTKLPFFHPGTDKHKFKEIEPPAM